MSGSQNIDEFFTWNRRRCKGTALHLAVLRGDIDEATTICEANPELVDCKFRYETVFKGVPQEGSGQAIHLAASKGNISMVELLLSKKASTSAMVTRNHQDHYDVLHAAVFADGGKGGNAKLVQFLLDKRAAASPNLDGLTPLHIAYQTGVKDVIKTLQNTVHTPLSATVKMQSDPCGYYGDYSAPSGARLHASGTRKSFESQRASVKGISKPGLAFGRKEVVTPLEHGFKCGKLSYEDLTELAPLSAKSFRVFLTYGPRCIPSFIARVEHEFSKRGEDPKPAFYDEFNVDVQFICNLFAQHPFTAAKLLNAATGVPDSQNEGHHPVPSRISVDAIYASHPTNSLVGLLLRLSNHLPSLLAYYKPDREWSFNSETFTAPAWHNSLTDLSHSSTLDVEMKVCYIPGIVRAEVFHAILSATDSKTYDRNRLKLFDEDVVYGLVEWTWWNAAWKFDILQAILNIMGLLQLGLYPRVGIDFVCARCVVDLALEISEFAGYVSLGMARQYFSLSNLRHLLQNSPMLAILFARSSVEPDNLPVWTVLLQSLTVLIYWVRLLGIFRCTQRMGMVLMPIQRSPRGILPALVVTMIFFVGLVQAVCVFVEAIKDGEAVQESLNFEGYVKSTLFQMFGILFVGSYPSTPAFEDWGNFYGTRYPTSREHMETVIQIVLYVGTLCFTIGLLNIFISVVSEMYQLEVEQARLTFIRERASGCLAFLVRMRILSFGWLPWYWQRLIQTAAIVVIILPFTSVNFKEGNVFLIMSSLTVLNVVVFQFPDKQSPLAQKSRGAGNHLWIAAIRNVEKIYVGQLAKIRQIVRNEIREELQGELRGLKVQLTELVALRKDTVGKAYGNSRISNANRSSRSDKLPRDTNTRNGEATRARSDKVESKHEVENESFEEAQSDVMKEPPNFVRNANSHEEGEIKGDQALEGTLVGAEHGEDPLLLIELSVHHEQAPDNVDSKSLCCCDVAHEERGKGPMCFEVQEKRRMKNIEL